MEDWDYSVDSSASLDPSGYDSLPVEVFQGDIPSMDSWSFGEPSLEDILMSEQRQEAVENVLPALAQYLAQVGGTRSSGEMGPLEKIMSLFGTTRQDPAELSDAARIPVGSPTEQVKAVIGGEGGPGFRTQQTEGQGGGQGQSGVTTQPIPGTDKVAVFSPDGKLVGVTAAQQQSDPFSWQKMLQLGMVGIGGLASYKDAQAKNKASKEYKSQMDQQRAAAQQHFSRTNLPGGYAALTPATTQFRRPV